MPRHQYWGSQSHWSHESQHHSSPIAKQTQVYTVIDDFLYTPSIPTMAQTSQILLFFKSELCTPKIFEIAF